MFKKSIVCLAVLIGLATGCQSSGGDAVTVAEREAETKMSERYVQPYVNAQLNSYQAVDMRATGRLGWKLKLGGPLGGATRFLHLLDDKRAILDRGLVFCLIDLSYQHVVGNRGKTDRSFISLEEGDLFSVIIGYSMARLEFDRYDEMLKGDHVPGLGEYSALRAFVPLENGMLAVVQHLPNPESEFQTFQVYEQEFVPLLPKWNKDFDGTVPLTPVSRTRQTIICQLNKLTVIDSEGREVRTIEGEFEPLSCSFGPDELIYLVARTGDGTRLLVLDSLGEVASDAEVTVTSLTQPPVVTPESVVCLVGSGGVQALREGEFLWESDLDSDQPLATAAANGRLVIADGTRVICLDADGQTVWIYQDIEKEVFLTPPVLNSSGKVLVASDKSVVFIE